VILEGNVVRTRPEIEPVKLPSYGIISSICPTTVELDD